MRLPKLYEALLWLVGKDRLTNTLQLYGAILKAPLYPKKPSLRQVRFALVRLWLNGFVRFTTKLSTRPGDVRNTKRHFSLTERGQKYFVKLENDVRTAADSVA